MDDVTNRTIPPDDAPSGVEALLRAAARFTPDAPVPDTLAFRALERVGLLPGVPRRRRASGFRPFVLSGGALAGAVGAGALVWLTSPAGRPGVTAQPDRTFATERSPSAPLPHAGILRPAPGGAGAAGAAVAQAVSKTRPPRSASRARQSATRVRRDWRASPHILASFRRRGGTARRPVFASVPPPKARWQTRTVERENYGVLTPAWVTFHAPAANAGGADEGEIVGATPVVVDLPLGDSPDIAYAAADIVPIDYDPHHP